LKKKNLATDGTRIKHGSENAMQRLYRQGAKARGEDAREREGEREIQEF
jgi:hypothetical protein